MEKTTGAVSLLNLTAQAGLNSLPNIGKAEQSIGETSFADAFMKTSEVKPSDALAGDVSKTKSVMAAKNSFNKNIKTAENAKGQEKGSYDEGKIEDIAKKVSKAADEIKDKIKDEFDVSDEDIEKAMEVLGFEAQNLLNDADLRNILMTITETTDSIELLTNVELYNSVKNVTSLANSLLGEMEAGFDMSQAEFAEIINEKSFSDVLNQLETDDMLAVQDENMADDVAESTQITADVQIDVSLNKAEKNVISDDAAATAGKEVETLVETEKTSKENTENANETERVDNLLNTEVKTADKSQNDLMNSQSGSKKQNLFSNSKNEELGIGQTQTVTTQTVNTVGDIVETVTSYSTNSNAENIMRQVTDYVRVNITEDVTKMEMQLHPASLGTVNMQINSQNGQITAHLTVQNELVKSVLESQMIKLQETFNEQGTKVAAIEVSVAEYNLDARSDNNYSKERDRNQGGSKRRSINLSDVGSIDDFTDEELLEAKVMEMNGSSVNYTA